MPFEENIALTRKVVEYAHDHGVVVEGRAGHVWPASRTTSRCPPRTPPTPVPKRSRSSSPRPACDSLAIAIGTSHGAYKFNPPSAPATTRASWFRLPCASTFWKRSPSRLPGFPIVLHGSSSVPQEFVKMINENGGKMPDAVGIPEEQLRQAAELSVCKINIDSDLRLAMTGTIRQFFDEHPDKFDPARVSEARPCQHQGARPPQAARRPRLRRQGLIASKKSPHTVGRFFICKKLTTSAGCCLAAIIKISVRRGVRRSQLHSASAEAADMKFSALAGNGNCSEFPLTLRRCPFSFSKRERKEWGANRADRAARPCMVQRKQKGAAIGRPIYSSNSTPLNRNRPDIIRAFWYLTSHRSARRCPRA